MVGKCRRLVPSNYYKIDMDPSSKFRDDIPTKPAPKKIKDEKDQKHQQEVQEQQQKEEKQQQQHQQPQQQIIPEGDEGHETVSVSASQHSDFNRLDRSFLNTKQADSAYGSHDTSQCHRSTGSSSKGASNISKSSGSGSSHFEFYKTCGSKGNVGKSDEGHRSPAAKKCDKKHKKSKSKSGTSKEQFLGGSMQREHVPEPSDQRKNVEPVPGTSKTPQDDKALKVAALSQALDFIDKFRKNQESKVDQTQGPNASEIDDLATNLQEASQGANQQASKTLPFVTYMEGKDQISDVLEQDHIGKPGEGFCTAVSLNDGMVMYTTDTIHTTLGYPTDMWIGRSFIDFVYPTDRATFSNQVTVAITLPFGNQPKKFGKDGPAGKVLSAEDNKKGSLTAPGSRTATGETFYCRLRHYNGLKQGRFSVKERPTIYNPFKLSVCFKELSPIEHNPNGSDDELANMDSSGSKYGLNSVCLIISAIPILSAYTNLGDKSRFDGVFVTRHSADCKFTMADEATISYTGYLPQDLEGNDIFHYYHEQDLPYLKEVYEIVIAEKGRPFKSKTFRIKARNGDYIHVETDWSCFINPWSRKLEFVVSKHTVVKGPQRSNLFDMPIEAEVMVPEQIHKESKTIKEEIKQILQETINTSQQTDSMARNCTRRRKQLVSFMGSLLEEMAKAETSKSGVTPDSSVVLGNISPHHDELSSETPPSYNQLNYNDNLTRFFNSQPKTLSEKEVRAISEEGVDVDIKSGSIPYGSTGHESSEIGKEKGSQSRKTHLNEGKSSNVVATVTKTSSAAVSSSSGIKSRTISNYVSVGPNDNLTSSKEDKSTKEQNESGGDSYGTGDNGGISGDSGLTGSHQRQLKLTRNKGSQGTQSGTQCGIGGDGTGSGDGTHSGTGSGNSRSGTSTESGKKHKYKPPFLTEELLLVHNRGMEKKMIDLYKDSKKCELRFIKNRWRNKPGHRHALKRQFKSNWRQEKAMMQSNAPIMRNVVETGASVPVHQSASVPLWPPFSVAGAGVHIQMKPAPDCSNKAGETQLGSHSIPSQYIHQAQVPGSSNAAAAVAGPQLVQPSALNKTAITRPTTVYHNLIPAYYIPAANLNAGLEPVVPHQRATAQRPAGFLVHAGSANQPAFIQQPMQYVPSLQPGPSVMYQTIDAPLSQAFLHPQAMRRESVGNEQRHATTLSASPDLPDSVSVESCITAGGTKDGCRIEVDRRGSTSGSNLPRSVAQSHSAKFQRPSSRTGSRATSIKAEPGSALESNASASVKDKQLLSPSYQEIMQKKNKLNLAPSEQASHSDSSSSLYSLLKSSDDYIPITGDSSNDTDKESISAKPPLPEPLWLQNVRVTPELLFGYQMKTRDMVEVLKEDMNKLKKMCQPSMVNQQLEELYKEFDRRDETPRSLLDDSGCSSNESLCSSDGEESKEKDGSKEHLKVQEKYDMFTRIYDADAPFPPSRERLNKTSEESTQESEDSSGKWQNSSSKDEKQSTDMTGTNFTSTSMGSSSAITIDQSCSSVEDANSEKNKSESKSSTKVGKSLGQGENLLQFQEEEGSFSKSNHHKVSTLDEGTATCSNDHSMSLSLEYQKSESKEDAAKVARESD